MKPSTYINKITGAVFKILPMREDELRGHEMFLSEYIKSLICELMGACKTFDVLNASIEYYTVINTLQYMTDDPGDLDSCRSRVIKMCKLLNRLERILIDGEKDVLLESDVEMAGDADVSDV